MHIFRGFWLNKLSDHIFYSDEKKNTLVAMLARVKKKEKITKTVTEMVLYSRAREFVNEVSKSGRIPY